VPPERTPVESERPCVAKQLVQGVRNFTVTIDNYQTYPNPPSWGVSYHFDRFGETPEIVVERGKTYTFVVAASDNHPLYIVDNDRGGQVDASERVFAGGAATHGTRANPAISQLDGADGRAVCTVLSMLYAYQAGMAHSTWSTRARTCAVAGRHGDTFAKEQAPTTTTTTTTTTSTTTEATTDMTSCQQACQQSRE
jgi:hypothetical protein